MFQMLGVFAEFERSIIQEGCVLVLDGPRPKVSSLVGLA
jgi:hypothetical protein